MKKIFILLFVMFSHQCFSQSQVDFFCSGKAYKLSLETIGQDKYNLKLIGSNFQTLELDSTVSWGTLTQTKRDSIVNLKLNEKGINVSNKLILKKLCISVF